MLMARSCTEQLHSGSLFDYVASDVNNSGGLECLRITEDNAQRCKYTQREEHRNENNNWRSHKIVSPAKRQSDELHRHCESYRRAVQKLTESRKGTEPLGVAVTRRGIVSRRVKETYDYTTNKYYYNLLPNGS